MFKFKLSVLVIVFLYSLNCIVLAEEITTKEPQPEIEYSAKNFGKLPDVSHLSISPDGQKVLTINRYTNKGESGTLVQTTELSTFEKNVLTYGDNKKIVLGWAEWANDNDVLVGVRYPSKYYRTPVTRTSLIVIDSETAEVRQPLTRHAYAKFQSMPVINDNIIDFLPDNPDEFILSLRTSINVATEVYKVNHKKRRIKRLHHLRADTLDWITDRQNNLRIAYRFDEGQVQYDYRPVDSKKWKPLFEYKVFTDEEVTPLGFDQDPNILFYIANHEGRSAIFKTDLSSAEPAELVYSHPSYDVRGSLVYSHRLKKVVGIKHGINSNYYFWDPSFKDLYAKLDRNLSKTDNHIVSFSRDEKRIIVLATSDTDSGTYYLWDVEARTLNPIAYRYRDLEPEKMASKEYTSYTARDGTEIPAFLTRTRYGKPGSMKPTIVFPHGGPISFTGRGFDYWTQFFASQGYNVFQMNFRGSSGYGSDFRNAGLGEWGGTMQTDVEDGTRWLIEQKIADPDRICIVGASYGGYAALMEASNQQNLYQCAVSFAGVSDLPLLLRHSKKFIDHKVVKEMLGGNTKELQKVSPVKRADKFDIPVLLVHGSKDMRVPVAHGRKMYKALKKNNKDVEYIEQKNGTHFLENEEHRLELFEVMEVFLKTYLSN